MIQFRNITFIATLSALAMAVGCGTTRTSDTMRTATEQLLISDAIDRAVGELHLTALNGQSVFLDDRYLADVVDRNYLVSSLRQQLLASGCVLKSDRNAADFVVEARAGAVGTNRHDLLFGIPSTNLPQILPFQGVPAAIPEVPVAKRRDQRGLVKVAVFAYHRDSGQPVWQSGIAQGESSLNDVWLLGAGPFEHGSLTKKPEFAAIDRTTGDASSPLATKQQVTPNVYQQALFANPHQLAAANNPLPGAESNLQLAEHQQTGEEPAEPRVIAPPPATPLTAAPAAPAPPTTPAITVLPPIDQPPPVVPPRNHSGSFYAIEQGAVRTSEGQMNIPLPYDPVPLPQPIVDTVQ